MTTSRPPTRSLCLALAVSLVTPALFAEERVSGATTARERAGELYDRGVAQFEHADYDGAAQSFLDADAAAPSSDAVRNALAAAQRAKNDALVRASAERGASRAESDPDLAAASRAALAELGPPHSNPTTRAAATAPPVEAASGAVSVSTPTPAIPDARATEAEPAWPRPVFYAGAVATGVLVGVTIWSGVDALQAKQRLPGTAQDNDDVRARGHRTDALLASSLVVGAATAYVGLVWVDWSKRPSAPRASASVDRRGAYVVVSGDF